MHSPDAQRPSAAGETVLRTAGISPDKRTPAARYAARLFVVTGPAAGAVMPVSGDLRLGRAENGGDLGGDTALSRHHAVLRAGPGGMTIEDLGSANGTFVNGLRVAGTSLVRPGDIIEVGDSTLRLALPGDAPAAGIPMTNELDSWPEQLVGPLFALPARWGWQASAEPLPVAQSPAPMSPRPEWIEPPSPDTGALHAARSKAVSKVIRRVAFIVVAGFAFASFRLAIQQKVSQQGSSAQQIYWVVLAVVAAVLVVGLLRALGGVRRATAAIRSFEQPYRVLRDAERRRHEQALHDWDVAVRRSQEEAAGAARLAAQRANGPLWFPVRPASQPARVDVLGGDPWRHGWASLLVTFGASVLAAGDRITILDFSGRDVGGGLVSVAHARGLPTSRVDLSEGSRVNLLDGVAAEDVAEGLAYALTGQPETGGDFRQERALATEMLRLVIGCLDGSVTFGRLAGGIRVLRQGSGEEMLTDAEVSRLAAHIGDVDQNEWTSRQLRFLASQLDVLEEIAHAAGPPDPLWTNRAVTLIVTPGGRDDRKELLDRLLIQTAQRAMDAGHRLGGFLVVAGADHLGAQALTVLSDYALRAGVRLVMMIDQPQGDLEKAVGTGGAVCIMKMYNHRDAAIAAEFVGKGYKFVVNQVTRQVGKTFTDSGGDSFAANTGHSDSKKNRPGAAPSLSDSRGHTWTGTRNWSLADNISTSTGSARVYEFIVDPQEILGMPETAFIMVDNSGQSRRVAMADANPGISLLDRVSASPA